MTTLPTYRIEAIDRHLRLLLEGMQLQHLDDQLAGPQTAQSVADLCIGGQVGHCDNAVLSHGEVLISVGF